LIIILFVVVMSSDLRSLIGPYEYLELPDRGVVRFMVSSFERGTTVIHPRYEGAPSEKTIEALRIHVSEKYKPLPPPYWDITSKTLIAQLLPLILERDRDRYEYVVTKYGEGVKARFTLERVPI